jgi:predicted metal-dependent peptidase
MLLYQRDILEPASMKEDGAEGATSEQAWIDAVAAAHGQMPSYLKRLMEEVVTPKKNWRQLLAQFISATIKSDLRSWTRQSRRVKGLPGYYREPESKIAICVDTSGSISPQLLNIFLAECRAICALNGIAAHIFSCDAELHEVVQPGEEFPTELSGGGGTSFIPGLEAAEECEADAAVYFTDGDGEYPKTCAVPVLWCLTKKHDVPFGESILLELGE